jgi:hypothetical protein
LTAADRNRSVTYDALGQLRTEELDTNESGPGIERAFAHDYSHSAGTYSRVGPDGVETFVESDAAGRATLMRRGTA